MQRAIDLRGHLRVLVLGVGLFGALTALQNDDSDAGKGLAACGLGAGGAGAVGAKAAKGCGGGAKALSGAGKLGAAKLGAKAGAVGLAGSEAAGLTHLGPALDDLARAGATGSEVVISGSADDIGRALSGGVDDAVRPPTLPSTEGLYLTADDLRLPPPGPELPKPRPLPGAATAAEEEGTAARVLEELGPDAVQQLAPGDDTGG